MDEFKVLLIGGPPGAGKTTLGRAVASRLGFASTTVDDLVVAGRLLTTKESHPALHQMRPVGHTRYFTKGPPERLISDAVELQDMMWPVLERVIRGHSTSGAPIVMDWWLFSPEKVANLEGGGVASIWIHIDPDVLWERERQNTDFLEDSTDPDRMLSNFMGRSLWRNEHVAREARDLGMTVVHQSGARSVEELVDEVLGVASESHGIP
ncbi:MAG: AAA family ATPase [Actinomycetota bacterium]